MVLGLVGELFGVAAVSSLLPLQLQEHGDGTLDLCAVILRRFEYNGVLYRGGKTRFEVMSLGGNQPNRRQILFNHTRTRLGRSVPVCEHRLGRSPQRLPSPLPRPPHKNESRYHLDCRIVMVNVT